jgi:hypothetical protein
MAAAPPPLPGVAAYRGVDDAVLLDAAQRRDPALYRSHRTVDRAAVQMAHPIAEGPEGFDTSTLTVEVIPHAVYCVENIELTGAQQYVMGEISAWAYFRNMYTTAYVQRPARVDDVDEMVITSIVWSLAKWWEQRHKVGAQPTLDMVRLSKVYARSLTTSVSASEMVKFNTIKYAPWLGLRRVLRSNGESLRIANRAFDVPRRLVYPFQTDYVGWMAQVHRALLRLDVHVQALFMVSVINFLGMCFLLAIFSGLLAVTLQTASVAPFIRVNPAVHIGGALSGDELVVYDHVVRPNNELRPDVMRAITTVTIVTMVWSAISVVRAMVKFRRDLYASHNVLRL